MQSRLAMVQAELRPKEERFNMGNITDYLSKIKTAIYGKDVRGAMHDAIKQVYDDAAQSGNANMEVTLARGTEPNLNARLEKMDEVAETTTAQLATKANQDYVTTLINSVTGLGISDVYYTFAALQSAFPQGTTGVFIVLDIEPDNPHKFAWSSTNSEWIDLGVYQWDSVPDDSVTLRKTNLPHIKKLNNLRENFSEDIGVQLFTSTVQTIADVVRSGTSYSANLEEGYYFVKLVASSTFSGDVKEMNVRPSIYNSSTQRYFEDQVDSSNPNRHYLKNGTTSFITYAIIHVEIQGDYKIGLYLADKESGTVYFTLENACIIKLNDISDLRTTKKKYDELVNFYGYIDAYPILNFTETEMKKIASYSEIKKRSIGVDKTSFFNYGINRLNLEDLKTDTGIDSITGEEVVATGKVCSGEIYCGDCANLYHAFIDNKDRVNSSAFTAYYYNEENKYLGYVESVSPNNGIAVIEGAFIAKIVYTPNTYTRRMLINGLVANSVPYEKFKYQIAYESETIQTEEGINLIDASKSVTGVINNSGSISESASYKVSSFRKIENGKTYKISSFRNLCFFTNAATADSTKFVSTESSNYSFVAPYDGYVRINYRVANEATLMMVEGDTLPAEYTPYQKVLPKDVLLNETQISQIPIPSIENAKFKGKKILKLGDSINDGDGNNDFSYIDMIAQDYEMEVIDYALGGAALGWIDGRDYEYQNIIKQVDDAIANGEQPDIIIFDGGINDISLSIPLGELTFAYSTDPDKTTILGATEYILKQLKTTYPNAKIIFVKVHIMGSRPSVSQMDTANAIESACKKWGVAVADVQQSGLNTFLDSHIQFTNNGDKTHPNELGYRQFYVPPVKAKMNELFE